LKAHPLKWRSAEASVLAERRGVSMEKFRLTKQKKKKMTEASMLAKNSNSSTF